MEKALEYSSKNNSSFIHPYDDYNIIQGQGTILNEILNDIQPDYISCCIGGGGLISGIINNLYNLGSLGNKINIIGENRKVPIQCIKL